ncbi:PspA/IM30 family protein [Sulfidibacter corallicola]|uniref:PspA/IM30 family protein n=1 Tax=Sulfidibacter corallicola TaxID=2818388 RepID=A0A8A4TE06_SULCO|nr:PspA/IM30 family protein [Sulfidibacter corallicola]QTD47800.1 PspA/IM30 family protein [Sulfidibacter corallicola]
MVFSRIFKIFQSEAHSVVDKLEDPIKMTEQGIRDLKNDLQQAMTSLAQVKSLALRLERDCNDKNKIAADYERKAMLLLQKAQSGGMEVGDADRLATEALTRKEEAAKQVQSLSTDYQAQKKMADTLQAKVEKLRKTIQRYENELVTLKARAKTAESMKKINKQLSTVDSSGTISMLEKMKQKVDEEESLAQAYGEVSDMGMSNLDDEIETALNAPQAAASDSLLELKRKMGMVEAPSGGTTDTGGTGGTGTV